MTTPTMSETFSEDNPIPDDGAGLEIFADLKISLDSLTSEMKKRNESERRRLAVLPRNQVITRISTPGAATSDVQDFGGPQPGRKWVVRLLAAVSVPPAANASLVTWYVGKNIAGATAAGVLPPNFTRWQFPSVPGFQNFTSGVIVVRFGQNLIAGLTSVPASSVIALIAAIDDQPQFAASARVAVE